MLGLVVDDPEAQLFIHQECSLYMGNRFFHTFGYGVMFGQDSDYEFVNQISQIIKLLQTEAVDSYSTFIPETIENNFKQCEYNAEEAESRFSEEKVRVSNVKGLWIIFGGTVLIGFVFHLSKLIYMALRNKNKFYYHGPFAENDMHISNLAQALLGLQIKSIEGVLNTKIRDLEKYLVIQKEKYDLNFRKEKLKVVLNKKGSGDVSQDEISERESENDFGIMKKYMPFHAPVTDKEAELGESSKDLMRRRSSKFKRQNTGRAKSGLVYPGKAGHKWFKKSESIRKQEDQMSKNVSLSVIS